MRTQIKDSWLKAHIGKDKKLYREYKTHYNKIVNINKLFFHHRICNIPMHPDTKTLCLNKVDLHLQQMSLLYYVAADGELPTKPKIIQHKLISFIPLGTWEKSVYISYYVTSRKKFLNLSKERKPKVEEKPKTLIDKIKSLFQ